MQECKHLIEKSLKSKKKKSIKTIYFKHIFKNIYFFATKLKLLLDDVMKLRGIMGVAVYYSSLYILVLEKYGGC